MRLFVTILGLLFVVASHALPTATVKRSIERMENDNQLGDTFVLPFAFSADSMGFTVGVAGMRRGFLQEQMTVGGTVFGGQENYGLAGGVWDYRFPPARRLFISLTGMYSYIPRQRAYTSGDFFVPPGVPAPGSNDSSADAFIEAQGSNNWFDIKLEYTLPIGSGREHGMMRYQLTEGILTSEPSGGERWNPWRGGVSVATLRQFNRYQSYEEEEGFGEVEGTIHPFELGLLYNNTDFPTNPSRGSSQYVAVTHDPAWLDSEDKWSVVEFEASKYFSIGASRFAHQRIFALNGWTAYSPSWELEFNEQGGSRPVNNPPFLEGATLGGFYRMRGYPSYRFHDKAAIYGTAEYRYTLRYNPIRNVKWLRFLNLDWFQLVAFAEGGRVAPSYTSSELFSDWKSDVGFSLRMLVAGVVARFDIANSPEGTNFWVMVGHPF